MKIKKYLPQIITAVISILYLLCAFIFSKLSVSSFPFKLYEKMGLFYNSDSISGIANQTSSFNGTQEAFISILKKFAADKQVIFSISYAVIFAALITISLILISDAVAKNKYKWIAYTASVLLPLVFLDFSNTSFFKTLYINPLVLTLLLLLCTAFIRMYKNNSAGVFGIITASVIAVTYSCIGNVQAITAIAFGILIVLLCKISKNNLTKILSVVLGGIVVIQSIIFAFTFKPYDYEQHLYNSIFFGVAQYDSVTEIGLDKKLDDFKGVYYGMKENEAEYDLENTFYSKISHKDIIKYYLTHPINALKVINTQIRLAPFGEFDFGFAPYNSLRSVIPASLLISFVIALVYIIVSVNIAKAYNSLKPYTYFASAIATAWFVSLIASAIYCGNCDIARNMYTSSILFDIMLLTALIGGASIVIQRQNEKKKEFGITHE